MDEKGRPAVILSVSGAISKIAAGDKRELFEGVYILRFPPERFFKPVDRLYIQDVLTSFKRDCRDENLVKLYTAARKILQALVQQAESAKRLVWIGADDRYDHQFARELNIALVAAGLDPIKQSFIEDIVSKFYYHFTATTLANSARRIMQANKYYLRPQWLRAAILETNPGTRIVSRV